MWITVAMSYYGLILINTSLMTLTEKVSQSNGTNVISLSTNHCQMLTTDDYKSLILTTFGEMLGIPLLVLFLVYIGRRRICFINFLFSSLCFTMFFFIGQDQSRLINVITFLARMFINSQFCLMYLYTMEVYPTVIRAMAVGCASSMSRIGAMITPYLAQVLIKKTFHGTIAIYVLATATAAVLALFLPIETKGRELKVRRNTFTIICISMLCYD
jgi:MFS family permease